MSNIQYLIFSIQEVFDNCQKLGSKYLVFWLLWELVEKVTSGGEGFFCVRQGREAMCRLKKFKDSFNSILTKLTPVSKGSTLFKSTLSYLVFAVRVQTLAQMVNDIKKNMSIGSIGFYSPWQQFAADL